MSSCNDNSYFKCESTTTCSPGAWTWVKTLYRIKQKKYCSSHQRQQQTREMSLIFKGTATTAALEGIGLRCVTLHASIDTSVSVNDDIGYTHALAVPCPGIMYSVDRRMVESCLFTPSPEGRSRLFREII